ncbi:MAG: dienelactone hydrolase family protein [Gemmatales bacterium]|nr:dienelactone hydrolase family protein [Gemmatales bacterium]MDW8221411.1 dienelactone hydrolase family protein [Gemmatales bacterium]
MILLSVVSVTFLASPGPGQLPPEAPIYEDRDNLLVYRDATSQLRPVQTPQDWQTRRAHILANMQKVMGHLPQHDPRLPLEIQVTEVTRTGRYVRRKISYLAEKGDRVPAYVFVPLGIKGKVPGVVCLHPTNRELGKGVVSGLGGLPNRAYAVELAERGFVTIAPDYVNMGEYQCDPYALGYVSATMKGIVNHRRAVDVLQSLPEVDGARIGAIGHSLGGHNSIFLAVFDERVKCVVSSCGYCSFRTYMKGDLRGWSHAGYMPLIIKQYGADPKKMPFEFTEVIAALAPRAFLTVAPTNDHNFDVNGVRECIRAAEPVYRLLGATDKLRAIYPQAGHDFPEQARQEAYQWLTHNLAEAP